MSSEPVETTILVSMQQNRPVLFYRTTKGGLGGARTASVVKRDQVDDAGKEATFEDTQDDAKADEDGPVFGEPESLLRQRSVRIEVGNLRPRGVRISTPRGA